MKFKYRPFTDEELIARVWDVEDIKNLISRFAYFEADNRRGEALDRLWVSKPENAATASYGRNWGFYVGMDEIRKYYVGKNRFGAPGTQMMQQYTSKLVFEAEDGLTAKGMWMGSGCYETAPNEAGVLEGRWVNQRVGVDFVKEDGEWKIWHLFIGTNFVIAAGESYIEQPLNTVVKKYPVDSPAFYQIGRDRLETEVALFDQIVDYPEREAFGAPTIPLEGYSALYNYHEFPSLPEEYRTFDPMTSYGPEGHPKYQG